jgi:hypothetical protein
VNDKLIGHGICFKLNNSNLSQCKWWQIRWRLGQWYEEWWR